MKSKTDILAETLATAWQEGKQLASLDEEMLPHNRAEAYRTRERMVALLNQPTAGWKLGAPSLAAQQLEGYDGPIPGRILRASVYPSDSSIPIPSSVKVECEIAFALTQDLPADYEAEWREWAEPLFALDITASRYRQKWLEDLEPQQRMLAQLADNGNGGFIVKGPPLTQKDPAAAMSIRLQINDNEIRALKPQPAPFKALFWICAHARECGIPLKKGELVLTGSLASPATAHKGDAVIADFSSAYQLAVNLN